MKKTKTRLFSLIAASVAIPAIGIAAISFVTDRAEAAESNNSTGLYALVTDNADWPITEPDRGVYEITSDFSLGKVAGNNNMNGYAAMYANGKIYTTTVSTVGTYMVTGNRMDIYDATTGENLDTKNLATNFMSVANAFTYDKVNDVVYAITYGANTGVNLLSTFDLDSYTFTPVKQIDFGFSAIATDPEGNLFGIRQGTADLYSIDITDGTTERITGWSETPGTNRPQALVWDSKRDAFVWAYTNNDNETYLVAINPDPDNLRASKIANLGSVGVKVLYSTSPMAAPQAPATIADLEVTYDEPGSMEGSITFTVPDTKVDGSTLSGNVTVSLSVDGVNLPTETAAAGSVFTHKVTFTEGGLHKVKARLEADGLKSEVASVATFVGFDTPTGVRNASYTLGENNALTITWTEPTAVNGGALKPLSYIIMHNGKEEATVTETKYETVIAGDLAVHNFEIIPVAGELRGEAVALERIIAGEAIVMPYSTTFANEDEFALFESINANDDRSTWVWVSWGKYVQYNRTYGDGGGDDWLVCPKMHLEKDHVYNLNFITQNNGPQPEAMKVVVAKGNELQEMKDGMVIFDRGDLTNRTNETFTVNFTVETDGEYNLGFYYCTDDQKSQNINLKAIDIKDIGLATAPKAVSDFTVAPGEDGALQATVSLVAPAERYNGEALTSLSEIVIKRDGQIIQTVNNPRPGQRIGFVDTTMPAPATYTYSAVAANEDGLGEELSTSLYVGALTLPISYDFSTPDQMAGFSMSSNHVDGTEWMYDEETKALVNKQEFTGSRGDNVNTPFFYLKKGQIVKVQFTCEGYHPEGSDCIFFVGLANIDNPTAVSRMYPAQVVRSITSSDQIESRTMLINEDGCYNVNISLENYGSVGTVGVKITSLEITADTDPDAPGAPTEFVITPDEEAALSGTFSFTMPKVTILGNTLEGSVGARIYNSSQELISEVSDKTPGEKVELELPMLPGLHSYYLYPYNDKGVGKEATCRAFAGEDVPFRISNILSLPADDNMSTEISWDVPTEGVNAGWFDLESMTYNIYVDGEKVANTDKPYYIYKVEDTKQKTYKIEVSPENRAGEGPQRDVVFNNLGNYVLLPFYENFENGEFHTEPWRITNMFNDPTFETVKWNIDQFRGKDALVHTGFLMSSSEAHLPKISLAGIKDAVLTFDHYDYYKAKSYIQIRLATDEVNYIILANVMHECAEGEDGWHTYTLDLSQFADMPVSIILEGVIAGEGEYASIANLRIDSPTLGVKNIDNSTRATIRAAKGTILVDHPTDVTTYVYDLSGKLIKASKESVISVAPGIYVVKAGSTTAKLNVK